ncbi:hypothetical protein D9M69_679790 [compost metagenome]
MIHQPGSHAPKGRSDYRLRVADDEAADSAGYVRQQHRAVYRCRVRLYILKRGGVRGRRIAAPILHFPIKRAHLYAHALGFCVAHAVILKRSERRQTCYCLLVGFRLANTGICKVARCRGTLNADAHRV